MHGDYATLLCVTMCLLGTLGYKIFQVILIGPKFAQSLTSYNYGSLQQKWKSLMTVKLLNKTKRQWTT